MNGLEQSYSFCLLWFTLVRSSATTTTTQGLSYSLAYHRELVESCTWNQGNMRISRKICWNGELREEKPHIQRFLSNDSIGRIKENPKQTNQQNPNK